VIINYVLSRLMMKMKIVDVRLVSFTDMVFRGRKLFIESQLKIKARVNRRIALFKLNCSK